MKRASAGFVLMTALFLIVTFAAIGAYLVTVASGQVEASTQDEQGARAYQAARTGIEWGAFQVLVNPAGNFATTICVTPAASQTLDLGSFGGPLGGDPFRVSVTCTRTSEAEGGATVQVYLVTATACNRAACAATGESTYVERQLQLVLAK
jgi:MSHA biogenesis protein MshP